MRYTAEQLVAAVANWNRDHPIGTPVRRFPMMNPRGGDSTNTTTRSEAWVMGRHSPVVAVVGMTGAMHLDQLEVIPEAEREKSAVPPVESLPAAKPKRAGAFFLSDVMDTVGRVLQDADDHNDPEQFIRTVITELQRPRHRIDTDS